jgi:predicted membrane-bound spermidine synthase
MVLIGIAGFLTGAPFPLASRLHLAFCGKAGRAAGLVDSMDHLGAFAGALFTGVLFIPLLGIIQTSLAIALVNTAALALLMMSERKLSWSQS